MMDQTNSDSLLNYGFGQSCASLVILIMAIFSLKTSISQFNLNFALAF